MNYLNPDIKDMRQLAKDKYELPGIKEKLQPAPCLVGGVYYEIKPGGLLKVHADLAKEQLTIKDIIHTTTLSFLLSNKKAYEKMIYIKI